MEGKTGNDSWLLGVDLFKESVKEYSHTSRALKYWWVVRLSLAYGMFDLRSSEAPVPCHRLSSLGMGHCLHLGAHKVFLPLRTERSFSYCFVYLETPALYKPNCVNGSGRGSWLPRQQQADAWREGARGKS